MTVGELKKELADMPDDMLVTVWTGPSGYEQPRSVTVNLIENGAGLFGQDAVCLEA